jgi:hypothetical protein
MNRFLRRLYYALGPLAAGIVLDALDLATFGPVGLVAGAVVGAYAGWMIGTFEGLGRDGRIAIALCAAVYMTVPMTEPYPVATVFTLVARFFRDPSTRQRHRRQRDESRDRVD